MTKDPIAEAKREGWNEACRAAQTELVRLARSASFFGDPWDAGYVRGVLKSARAIRSLHKPTEESET